MPTRSLPANPDLRQLKRQAKDLLTEHGAASPAAFQRLREFHPRLRGLDDSAISAFPLRLADAQLAIAREHGFPSWTRLRAVVASPDLAELAKPQHERVRDPAFRRGVDLVDAGDVEGLRALLAANPGLERRRETFEGGNYFRNPVLLHFVAGNPYRRPIPPNVVEVARVLLDAGATNEDLDETLGLVASSSHAREAGVQLPLIDLLVDRGATPDAAVLAALGHEERVALARLLERGARLTLPVAAALGSVEEVRALARGADAEVLLVALAAAAAHGREDAVGALLEAGADPDRYIPPSGFHAHATPLHVAVAAGRLGVVRVLVEAGARVDIPDILWGATPLGWAEHEGRIEVAAYLRAVAGAEARTAD